MGTSVPWLKRFIGGVSTVDSQTIVGAHVDPYSQAQLMIETEHAWIHAGKAFSIFDEVVSLPVGSSVSVLVYPAIAMHFRNYSVKGNPLSVQFYENPVVTTTGTQITPRNRNRLSSKVSSAGIYVNAAVSSVGYPLDKDRIVGAGTGTSASGEISGLPLEWTIDGGIPYMMTVTNEHNQTNTFLYRFFWYELGL